jgi:hypothetical protein
MNRLAILVLLPLLLLGARSARGAPEGAAAPDALDEALAAARLTRADLGWRAKGWWAGYPDVPQQLRHTDDLFAEPLATVPFLRGLGAGVRDLLDPAKVGEKGVRGAGWLHRAAHLLGVDRRFGALRSYSANSRPSPRRSTRRWPRSTATRTGPRASSRSDRSLRTRRWGRT